MSELLVYLTKLQEAEGHWEAQEEKVDMVQVSLVRKVWFVSGLQQATLLLSRSRQAWPLSWIKTIDKDTDLNVEGYMSYSNINPIKHEGL